MPVLYGFIRWRVYCMARQYGGERKGVRVWRGYPYAVDALSLRVGCSCHLPGGLRRAPGAVTTPAGSAPTTLHRITNTSTTMPTVEPAANSTGSTPSAGPTQNSTSSGSGAGSTVYTIVQGKSQAQYSVREQLARLQLRVTPSERPSRSAGLFPSIPMAPSTKPPAKLWLI